jgi:hypothetical protein
MEGKVSKRRIDGGSGVSKASQSAVSHAEVRVRYSGTGRTTQTSPPSLANRRSGRERRQQLLQWVELLTLQ